MKSKVNKVQHVPKTVPRSARNKIKRTLDVTTDLFLLAIRLFRDPYIAVTLMLAAVFLVTHKDFSNAAVGKLLSKSTSPLAKWLLANSAKFVGAVIFLPAVLSLKSSSRVPVILALVAWLYIAPAETIVGYSVMSVLFTVYFRALLLTTRLLAITILIGLVFAEYFSFKL